jgi:hypothetical protein
MGIVASHPPVGSLFLAAGASAPIGPAAVAARPLDAAAAIDTGTAAGTAGPWATTTVAGVPAGTAAGTPAWPYFDPSMDGAPYWSTPHTFFAALQYGFSVQPAWPSSFDSSMGGAPYWSSLHSFTAPQYGFHMQQVVPSFTSATTVISLDAVVWRVGPAVPHRLP